jgi:hypothetical protein
MITDITNKVVAALEREYRCPIHNRMCFGFFDLLHTLDGRIGLNIPDTNNDTDVREDTLLESMNQHFTDMPLKNRVLEMATLTNKYRGMVENYESNHDEAERTLAKEYGCQIHRRMCQIYFGMEEELVKRLNLRVV